MRLDGGESELAEVVRALDAEGIAIENLQLHAPSLDDVFLAKTGRSLEGAGRRGGGRGPAGGEARRERGLRTQVGQLARRSVAAHPAPAGADRPGADLPARSCSR